MSKHLSAATMPDYFGKRYDSKALRIAAAAIAFIFLIPYTASVYNGLSRLFGMAFNIPYSVFIFAIPNKFKHFNNLCYHILYEYLSNG